MNYNSLGCDDLSQASGQLYPEQLFRRMGPWMWTWLQGLVWWLNKWISCDRVTRIPMTCLWRGKIFRWGTCVTRIPITCLRQEEIFCQGPCITRIPITCLRRGKIFLCGPCVTGIPIIYLQWVNNFCWGPLEFSTRRAYFCTTTSQYSHYCWSEQISVYNFASTKKQNFHYCCYPTSSNLLISFLKSPWLKGVKGDFKKDISRFDDVG